MNSNNIHNVYFIGIGGIGMSALARYFVSLGKNVAGYDKTPTQITAELQKLGITISFKDTLTSIDSAFLNRENTLVVLTPAIPTTHTQLNYFLTNNFTIKKRAEVLGIITKDTFCFAVAGTHGKTTTSSILAHILQQSNVDVTAFLGGIAENYNSNLVGTGTTVTVVEADEFDRSFLHLHPNIACITSTDADHLDIYKNTNEIEKSFQEFASKVSQNNLYVTTNVAINGISVSVTTNNADFSIKKSTIKNGYYIFSVKTPTEIIEDIQFSLPGHHNLSNALMAIAMAKKYGISTSNIKKALASFKGVRRRFSFQVRTQNKVYIDDYAHHPTEIKAVHQAVTELYPNKEILAIFQPHLFSRTKDFAADFAQALSQFKNLILLDIYPAREQPIKGITSAWLLNKITSKNKQLLSKSATIQTIKNSTSQVIITMGAGDIGEMVTEIKTICNEKN